MREGTSPKRLFLDDIKEMHQLSGDKRNFKKRKGAIFTPCVHCRSITVARAGSGWGTVRQVFDDKGNLIDTDVSKMNMRMSTVLRCTYCGTIRKDITFPSQKLVRK